MIEPVDCLFVTVLENESQRIRLWNINFLNLTLKDLIVKLVKLQHFIVELSRNVQSENTQNLG